jgi:hypothetical protein
MDQSNSDCRIFLSDTNRYSIEVPISAYDNNISTYQLKIVDISNTSVANSSIPPIYYVIPNNINKDDFIFFDYYGSNTFYIFYQNDFNNTGYPFIDFSPENFYNFFNFWVINPVFTNAYEDSTFFDQNPCVHYDDSSSSFYINKNYLIKNNEKPLYLPHLSTLYNIYNPSFAESSLFDTPDEVSLEDIVNFDLNSDEKLLDSKNLLDNLLHGIMEKTFQKVISIPKENSDTSMNANQQKPVCTNYTFISDIENVVSKNYQFANKIKYFPICSHPSRVGEISFCNYHTNSQSNCPIYRSSEKILVSHVLNENEYTLKYILSPQGHKYDVVIDNETYVMNYSFPSKEYSYEKSLEISLGMFQDFIDNFNTEYETKNLQENENVDVNILSKDFFVHLVNS